MAEKAFTELDVDDLYHTLEKELGADIATVLRDEDISGEDFLELTEKEVEKMFSKLGQKKKVLRFIKGKHVPITPEATPSSGQNVPPLILEEQHRDAQVAAQTSPTSTFPTVMQPDVSDHGNIAEVPQHVGRNTSESTAEGDPISSPVAEKHHAGNKMKHHKLSQREMARNLDKLSKEELYFLLAEKVDQEAATAIKNEGVSGGTLIDLTDTELRDLLPKLGPRRMIKRLVDDFHSSPSEPEMDKGLNELDKEELFMWLSPKVDDDVAHAVLDNELSGAGLLDLNDDELKEVVPKLGPRKALKKLIDDFKGVSAAQQKVTISQQQTTLHVVDSDPLASREGTQLNQATTVPDVQGMPSTLEKLNSQMDPSALGQRHSIPMAHVQPLPSERLALRVKEQSECIQTEHQYIYKLKFKQVAEDKEKGVAKYRFGKARPDKQEYVVMLVGATGAGKSTLINGMVNYIFGVDWKDDFRFKLIVDEGGTSQAHSQTTTITAYTIPHQQGSPFDGTLTIVDTPGFGDTKGIDSDKRIVEQIRTFFSMSGKKGIDHIHGIGFVTQAALARLTPTQRYVFASILAVFGKDIGKNILMMTTFADGKTPPVLEAVDEAGIGYCQSFKFNNSALYTDQVGGGQQDEVVSSFDKMFWDMGMASFKAFFKQLACMEARSLQLTKEVLEERKQLEVIIQSLPLQIQAILGKIGTLQQEEHIMEQHKADIAANKNFKYKVKEPRIVKHETVAGQYVTNCTKCNFTCHRDCAYANNDDKRYCCAMSEEHCEVCQLKCHWSSHVNNPFWFEAQEVTVEKTYDGLKKRYEAALSGKSSKENIVSMIRAEIATSYQEVFLMIRQAQQILRRLDEIALHPNPLSEVEYIDLLINTEEMDGGPGAAQRIICLKAVREKAELMSTVKDDKIFEHKALKQAEKLAKAEAEKVGWLKKAATTTWNALAEIADHFK